MLISAYGCAQKENNEESSAPADTASVQAEESSEAPLIIEPDSSEKSKYEFSLDTNKPYDSVDEYLESDSAKQILKKLEGPDEQGIIITRIYAEKSTCLVFERKMSKDLNIRIEEDFKKNIAATVDSNKEAFSALVTDLEACINRKNITVAVRYLDPEGKLIYESIFDNDDLTSIKPDTSKTESRNEPSQTSAQQSSRQQSEASA